MASAGGARHICTFIPPYMLRHIANNPQVEQHISASAQRSLEHTLSYHRHRSSGVPAVSRPDRSGFIPQFILRHLASSEAGGSDQAAGGNLVQQVGTAKTGAQFNKQREVHDVNNRSDTSDLPGILITSDAKPATASIEHTVIDCFDNLGAVYDFYANVFKRNSIDDKGLVLIGTVHFGKNYENAFWNGAEMVFGDGGTFLSNFTNSLDVVGHELTHGVTEHTASLIYSGQSGALNESISDVFGSMIRQYKYKQSATEADWLIGEDCILPDIKGLALRSMKMPGTAYDDPRIGKDPQPAHMKDYQNLPDTDDGDNGGVHINSGIPNRAFYEAAMGFGGCSWEKAGPVWYATITGKEITNKCDFGQFAALTVGVARGLYGEEGAKVLTHAWTTVGVLGGTLS